MNRNKPLAKGCQCNISIKGIRCNKPTVWNMRETVTYGKPKTKAVYNNAYCAEHYDIAERMLELATNRANEMKEKGFIITAVLINVKKLKAIKKQRNEKKR